MSGCTGIREFGDRSYLVPDHSADSTAIRYILNSSRSQSDLQRYYRSNTGKFMRKWEHYFDIYERHFARYRGRAPVVVEIGVYQGGSLEMWRDYFGEGTRVYGIDVNPACAQFASKGIEIIIGSQSDRKFLRSLKDRLPRIDVLIDDGGHKMHEQIRTLEELYDHISDDGVYLCEDVHSSYRVVAGGGYRRRGTFIEYAKGLIDYLNAFNSRDRRLKVNRFTRTADSIHFYTSVVVIEKALRTQPVEYSSGQQPLFPENPVVTRRFPQNAAHWIRKRINKVLNLLRLPSI